MYNLPGLPNNLHITGPIIAGIYLGQIKKWNDPKIKAVNKGVNLPSLDDHSRLQERLERHVVQLHHVPEHGQPAVEVADRSRDDRQLAGRCRCTR